MLELYHHGTSVCAVKVRLALAAKQLDWKGHYIDILKGEQFTPAYLAINPKAVVPVLKHDDYLIRESTVICEYLEEVFPEHPVYPDSAYDRAQVRLWTKAVDEELHPACSAITYTVSHRHTIMRHGTGSFDDFIKAGAAEGYASRTRKWRWIQEGLEAPGVADKIKLYDAYLKKMDDTLMKNKWMVGDSLSMADLALAPYLFRLQRMSMDAMWSNGRYSHLERWYSAITSLSYFEEAVTRWVPQELDREMKANGDKSWPEIQRILGINDNPGSNTRRVLDQ